MIDMEKLVELIPQEASLLAFSILFTIEGLWVILCNFATILTFYLNRNIFRRAVYCLVNLALSDMLYGVFLTCYYNYVAHAGMVTYQVLLALETVKITSAVASGSCLLLVALERVFATYFPFRHRTTGPSAWLVAITLCWCFPVFVSTTYLHTPPDISNVLTFITLCCALLTLFMIISSYIAIFIKVRHQNKFLHQQMSVQTAVLRERNMAYTMMLVTFISLLTWLPFLVVRLSVQAEKSSSSLALHLAVFVQASNSFLNSIIYVLRMKEFRKALSRLLCKRTRVRVHPIINQASLRQGTTAYTSSNQ